MTTVAITGPSAGPAPLTEPDQGLQQEPPEEKLLYDRYDYDSEQGDHDQVRSVKASGQAVGRGTQIALKTGHQVLERQVEQVDDKLARNPDRLSRSGRPRA